MRRRGTDRGRLGSRPTVWNRVRVPRLRRTVSLPVVAVALLAIGALVATGVSGAGAVVHPEQGPRRASARGRRRSDGRATRTGHPRRTGRQAGHPRGGRGGGGARRAGGTRPGPVLIPVLDLP